MKAIEMQNLTKYYGKHRAVTDLNLTVQEGEVYGFIGPNGAGKSTTIRMLLNFIFPTKGYAKIFGKDIITESMAIKKDVGYLPSEVHYYDNMKVKELLNYSAGFYKKKASNTRIKELSDRLELDLSKKFEDLSFGNRKKVGIVQALLHEPRLLIMDEPTGGLDPLMQHTFFDLLLEEKEKGVTIFFSSHILSEVQKMCDRVAIIKEGELIANDTIENLTKNQFKNVTILLAEEQTIDLTLEGIIRQEQLGQTLKLLYRGDVHALVHEISQHTYRDLLIEEPSLDEIFMHFYENEKNGGAENDI
ncbi:ABC transporter ATP-binding protein [Alkalihalobacillus sp. AL-G]|uniref:ABC transporter ATP-binding protein n=1 Tax=Alkalihalobacillus sp. AL-G TaxID=2926399 RepID=UPI00272C2869|nr:ABC transporter ATP-binding protein [Alkalihalobacillus sp. AL-G]WLD91568.1 ABC transporter ATP-binding protein [Alkalihalobacillus sp. AL-G]